MSQKKWVLTAEAFDKLLDHLDEDRDRAGEKYEKIRFKLVKFFRWRGCSSPEDYVDRTIDRVARRLNEGADLRVEDPYLYFHGVALNVLREHWREPERDIDALDGLPSFRAPATDPEQLREADLEQLANEQQLDCLDECVAQLSPETLNLIRRYHQPETGLVKNQRKELAAELKIPANALRIRAYRIRASLESCVENCVKRTAID